MIKIVISFGMWVMKCASSVDNLLLFYIYNIIRWKSKGPFYFGQKMSSFGNHIKSEKGRIQVNSDWYLSSFSP